MTLSVWISWWLFVASSSAMPSPAAPALDVVAVFAGGRALELGDFAPNPAEALLLDCHSHGPSAPPDAYENLGDNELLCILSVRGDTSLDGRACAHAAMRARGARRAWFLAAAVDCDCLEQRADLSGTTERLAPCR